MRRSIAALISGEEGYLDAGTGSIIIQAVIGGLVGVLVAIKLFWNRIKIFLSKIFRRQKKSGESEDR